MPTLLQVSASPRGTGSDSLALADAFLDAYRPSHPDAVIEHLDLFEGTLASFGPLAGGAKLAAFAGGAPGTEQQGGWDAARAVFDRFADADTYHAGSRL